jgi:hypothetical protein
MRVLKRKEEPTQTITLRVPASVKAEMDRLRERTSEAGFDLNATICESIIRLTRQMRDEMDGLDGKTAGRERFPKTCESEWPRAFRPDGSGRRC